MKPKIVYVKWKDACSDGSWREKQFADDIGLVECENVGFLIRETDEDIVLAAGLSDELYGDLWVIPKGNLIKTKVLKEKK